MLGSHPATKVSLSFELAELEAAMDGIQALLEPAAREATSDPALRKAVRSAGSLLAMVSLRIRQVRRAITGSVSPRDILADHNAVVDCDPSERQRDVTLDLD